MKKVYCFAALFGAILGVSLASCNSEEEELNESPVSEKLAFDKNETLSDEEVLFSTFDNAQKNGLKSSTILTYDIKILHGNSDNFPEGQYIGNDGWFNKINIDLNNGAGGEWIYLYYRTANSVENCITNMMGFASGKSYTTTDLMKYMSSCFNTAWFPGFDQNNNPVDLNAGAGGKYVYLELSKDRTYAPITGIQIVSTTKDFTQIKSKVEGGRTYYPVICCTTVSEGGCLLYGRPMDFNLGTKKHKRSIFIYYTRE
ncbi:MAG: hypothetical protein IKP81_06215 [Paludibacteraceae bacterium]|nr:hypothetical protein [Paludibacteraceae bacterium]